MRLLRGAFKKLVLLMIIVGILYFLKGNITGMTIFDLDDNNIYEDETDNIEIIETVNENIDSPEIYFCPTHNCSAVMVDLIENAETVHCALFDLDLYELIEVLDERSKSIDVKVVVDNDNYDEIEESYGKDLGFNDDNHGVSNGFIKQDNGNQLTHNKFCIIDNKKITTGSFNPTFNGNNKNNNNLIVIESEYLAENYESEFDELWNGYFGRSNKDKQNKVKYPEIKSNNNNLIIENYFCPDDNCEKHVLNVLEDAKESVRFMVFSFTSDPIGDKLIELHENGIIIEGVLEKKQNTNKYSEYHKLIDAGIDVIYDNNKYNMHHKTFIIDDSIVITGSYNPSASGNNKNDENVLVIYNDEVAVEYLEEFGYVFG